MNLLSVIAATLMALHCKLRLKYPDCDQSLKYGN